MRLFLLARLAWIEASRQRVFLFLAPLAAAFLFLGGFLRKLDLTIGEPAADLKFLADFGAAGLHFFGVVLALVLTAQLFFTEVESRSLLTLLAKPVRRGEWLLGRFLGVGAVLAVFVAVLTTLMYFQVSSRAGDLAADDGTPLGFHTSIVLWQGLAEWLCLLLVSSLALLLCSFARTLVYAVAVGTLAVVTAHILPVAAKWLLAYPGGVLLVRSLPDFQLFQVIGWGLSPSGLPPALLGALAGQTVVYLTAFLGLACFSFHRREL